MTGRRYVLSRHRNVLLPRHKVRNCRRSANDGQLPCRNLLLPKHLRHQSRVNRSRNNARPQGT